MNCDIYFLRHGELTEKQVLAGHTDFELSPIGWQQLESRAEQLSEINHVFSSPLKRCCFFAEQYAQTYKLPITIDDALKEMNFGDWDGKSYQSLWSLNTKPNIGDFWQNPWQVSPPNGETMIDFVERVTCWWQSLLAKPPQGSSLVVTHAGVIKQVLALIIGGERQNNPLSAFNISYAGLVKVSIFVDEEKKAWPQICF